MDITHKKLSNKVKLRKIRVSKVKPIFSQFQRFYSKRCFAVGHDVPLFMTVNFVRNSESWLRPFVDDAFS